MKRNLLLLGSVLMLGSACTSQTDLRQTQVVTFPRGGIVEYNGKRLGREPVVIALPQDENGKLAARSIIRASPSERMTLAETRILEPGERLDRVPDRIMLDISPYVERASGSEAEAEIASTAMTSPRRRAESPRGKSQR